MKRAGMMAAMLLGMVPLTGCIGVGYSSGGGLFIWPPIGLVLVILLVIFVLRRR